MVRQVKVNIATAKHILIRPITKLCLLATNEDLKIASSDLNGESVPRKVTGSVNEIGTEPVITGDGGVDDKKNVKTVKVKFLKQEKALKSVKPVKLQSTNLEKEEEISHQQPSTRRSNRKTNKTVTVNNFNESNVRIIIVPLYVA